MRTRDCDTCRRERSQNIIAVLDFFEFIERDDIPPMVSMNEAIELGKRFGTSESGSFINGILDRIARNLGLKQVIPEEERRRRKAEAERQRRAHRAATARGGAARCRAPPGSGSCPADRGR